MLLVDLSRFLGSVSIFLLPYAFLSPPWALGTWKIWTPNGWLIGNMQKARVFNQPTRNPKKIFGGWFFLLKKTSLILKGFVNYVNLSNTTHIHTRQQKLSNNRRSFQPIIELNVVCISWCCWVGIPMLDYALPVFSAWYRREYMDEKNEVAHRFCA